MNNQKIILGVLVFLVVLLTILLLCTVCGKIAVITRKDPLSNQAEHYFRTLYPVFKPNQWSKISDKDIKKLYTTLGCIYTPIIKHLYPEIQSRLPKYTYQYGKGTSRYKPDDPYSQRLFDGSICDCLRVAWPECKNESRFSASLKYEQSCPQWSGLQITMDTDWQEAVIKHGGLPDYSFTEVLTYPGEYGMPETCPSGTLSKELQGNQPGISVTFPDGTTSGIPFSTSPWWNGGECRNIGDDCKLSFMDCSHISKYGESQGNYCIAKPFPPDQKPALKQVCNPPCTNTPYSNFRENYEDDNGNDCTNWTDSPCKTPPNSPFYHSLYFYPIRGTGVWTNVGRTFPALTKLGFLLTPKDKGGPGYKLKDLLQIADSVQGKNGIKAQVQSIADWLNSGRIPYGLYKYAKYKEGTMPDLYKGEKIDDENEAYETALDLVTKYYIEGYRGKDPLGNNYDIVKWFPVGALFTYSSAFDVLFYCAAAALKYDTIQQLTEPQHSEGSMRPAYMFEIIRVIPTKAGKSEPSEDVSWVLEDSIDQSGCDTNYIVNPLDDYNNYKNYGYVDAEATSSHNDGSGLIKFDNRIMKLTPRYLNDILN